MEDSERILIKDLQHFNSALVYYFNRNSPRYAWLDVNDSMEQLQTMEDLAANANEAFYADTGALSKRA